MKEYYLVKRCYSRTAAPIHSFNVTFVCVKADEKLAEFAEKTQELQAKKKVEEEKLGKLATKEDEAAAKVNRLRFSF